LEANPKGQVIPRIYLSTPQWGEDANPDECQVLAHSGAHYRDSAGHDRAGRTFPSLASARWRADTAAPQRRVLRHIQGSDYGAHPFGCLVTGLMSEQWYHWSIHTNELSDYGTHVTSAKNWLPASRRRLKTAPRCWF
jgi:hypothetical protein